MKNNPVAVCTVCGKYAISASQIGNGCYEKPNGKNKCKGCFGSALSEGDWGTCDMCNGTGKYENSRCECCQGFGVMYVRQR